MQPMAIEGIGILNARGRGIERLEEAMREGWVPPTLSEDGRPAYRLSADILKDPVALKHARRADRFSKLTVLAAYDALRDSGLNLDSIRHSTGILVATAFGSHGSIFKFLDGIIEYGELNVSPTTFAHSIHNAAASYVAATLQSRGPAMTITQFHFSFQQSLLLAYAWLAEGRAKHVLVGAADECSPAMEYICEEKLSVASDGRMHPMNCLEKPAVVPGEGAAFFLRSLEPSAKKYGAITGVEIGKNFRGWNDVDLSILGANAMGGSEQIYQEILNGKPAAAYASLYGGLMTGGFECAVATLTLKNQPVNAVQCVFHNCDQELAFVRMER